VLLDEFGEGIGVAAGDPPLLHFLFVAHWRSPGWVVSALVILPLYHRRRGEMTNTEGPYSQFESMREIFGAELRGLHSQGDLGNE
jgi:hypothetical protein